MPSRKLSQFEFKRLSDRLDGLRVSLGAARPHGGWLNTVRRAIGMTTGQLARRVGISQPSVVRAEEREKSGTISLETLGKLATQLDCDLVYFLVPKRPLTDIVTERAQAAARQDAAAMARSLGLEWQVVPPLSAMEQIDREAGRLAAERPSRIWDLDLPVDQG